MTETDTAEQQRSDDYDDVSAKHVAAYCRERYDSERLAKLCFGVAAGQKSNGSVGRATAKGNRERIKREFDGLEYDELAAEARNWTPEVTPERALDELDGHGGSIAEKSRREWEKRAEETDESDTSGETDEFRRKVRERLSGRCNMLADEWLSTMENMADGVEKHELDPSEIVMCRKSDAEAGARLRERLTREAGIPEDEARELSVSSLRQISGDGSSLDELTPAPKSGDPQASSDVTRYSDASRAEELKQRIEYIENNSSGGELMEAQKQLYEEKLAELEQ